MSRVSYQEVVILNGQSLSAGAELDLRNHRLIAIDMPATWTAAAISFAGCVRPDNAPNAAAGGEPFDAVFDSAGVEVSLTVVQAHYVVLTEAHRNALAGLARVKVRSGLVGAAVNQGQDVRLVLVLETRESNT